jgi:hypothetical protein
MRNTQRVREKLLAREFLHNELGITIYRLLGRSPPRADCYAVIEKNKNREIIEIELTEYQVDTTAGQKGGSPGVRLDSFWRKVNESLRRRLSRKPIDVEVIVTFDDASAVKNSFAPAFAAELVRLARGFDFPASRTCTITVFKPQFPRMAEFLHTSKECIVRDLRPEFPLLAEFARTLVVTKVSYNSLRWACTNASAAMVGLLPNRLAADVRNKSSKTYKWAKNSEKWLLICAAGDSVVGTAGPSHLSDGWQDTEVLAACRTSSFDRVYFWDRPHQWHKRLK